MSLRGSRGAPLGVRDILIVSVRQPNKSPKNYCRCLECSFAVISCLPCRSRRMCWMRCLTSTHMACPSPPQKHGCGFFAYSRKLLFAYSGAFLLTIVFGNFLLTVGAFSLAVVAFLESACNKHPKGLQAKKLNRKQKEASTVSKKLPPNKSSRTSSQYPLPHFLPPPPVSPPSPTCSSHLHKEPCPLRPAPSTSITDRRSR